MYIFLVGFWSVFLDILRMISFLSYIDLRASHHLFEPEEATNLKVGNWSRYCKSHSLVKNVTDFCKVWIGIKWNTTDSKFKFESDNSTLQWSNFKHPENNLASYGDQCKYRTCDKEQNCVLR